MDFLISGVHIHPVILIAVGFVIGVLGGFFGVGGSFLAGPVLFALGVPMNFVVGTDLAHIVGKSVVAAKIHRVLGNVDIKLGMIMVVGTIPGVEVGAQGIQYLKHRANIDQVVGMTFVFVLLMISAFVGWESLKTILLRRGRGGGPSDSRPSRTGAKKDESVFRHIARAIHRIPIPPLISLPACGIKQISLWPILLVAFVGGVFSGFLGGGAGYIRMPCMVYLLGVPTHLAVGTDLFEIIISASYGTVTHALKGNVDILIALVMNTGAAIGAQIGAASTEYFSGPWIRLAFVPLPLIGAGIMIYSLVVGHRFH